MFLQQEVLNKIQEFLIENFQVSLIYIFGSAVKGPFLKESDIDIAFLSDETYEEYDVFMKAQELAIILNRDVDLIELKKASTVFKAQIVGTGEKIFCSDENRRMYFEMYALKEYALLNEERAEILEHIQRRGSVYGE